MSGKHFSVSLAGVGSDSAVMVAHRFTGGVGGTPEKQPEFTFETNHTK